MVASGLESDEEGDKQECADGLLRFRSSPSVGQLLPREAGCGLIIVSCLRRRALWSSAQAVRWLGSSAFFFFFFYPVNGFSLSASPLLSLLAHGIGKDYFDYSDKKILPLKMESL